MSDEKQSEATIEPAEPKVERRDPSAQQHPAHTDDENPMICRGTD
jgi:hypothetical protein